MEEKLMYNILGFSQKELVKLKLDLKDALIINYIGKFIKSGKMITEIVNGETFYWIEYKSLLESLPVLKFKKDALYNRLKILENKKVLKHYTKKCDGTYSFYAFGENYETLLYKKPDQYRKLSSRGMDNKQGGYEENLGPKYSLLKDSFNNNSIVKEIECYDDNRFSMELVKDVIDYLNHVSGSKFSYADENNVKLIKRWALEGYTAESFKKVIDKKSSEWGNTDLSRYIRPKTLFGDKFYKYVNEKFSGQGSNVRGFNNFEAREYDYEKLERQLLGWDEDN